MTDDSGSLSVGQRIRRMEEILERIEGKLDSKVDRGELKDIHSRLQLLESGETPLGKVMLEQFVDFQRSVNEIKMHGSKEAQEALARIGKIETKVETLESQGAERRATDRTVANVSNNRYKLWTLLLAAMTVIMMAANIYAALNTTH